MTGQSTGGWRFAIPWIVGAILLYALPLMGAGLIACTSWDGLTGDTFRWIGAANFTALFEDRLFLTALGNSLAFAALNVPVQLFVGLTLALLVKQARRGRSLWAMLYYAPHLVAGVATILIWWWLLNPRVGPINQVIRVACDSLGLSDLSPSWLFSPKSARPSLVFMNMWYAGGPMLIFLAALLRSSNSIHEAATLDGATRWQRFRFITIPQLAPAILFNAITLFVGSMQSFEQAFLLSNWEQRNALLFSSVYMYQSAFERHRFAYSLAQGLMLLLLLGAVAAVAVVIARRRVVYDFEEAGT